MKRTFTFLIAAFMLLAFLAIPMGMMGQTTVTLTASNLGLTGSYTTNTEKTIDGITYVYTDLMKNSSNIQAKANSGTIRNTTAYAGDITSVAITHSGTARSTTIWGSANGTDYTQVATGSGTITGDFSGSGYKYFKITRGSNAAYWTQIKITYTSSSSTVATPTFSPAAGTYVGAQNVTISCETEGATIYYTTDGTDPTNTSTQYTGAIAVSETTTIKAIAYVGETASNIATATYTITTPYTSIPDLFDAATSSSQAVYVTFNNWVVSGV
ncbi:MAG: chitobiase/beta-hexosaminidase C-terminal domain-containing protein, partial [Bacteroidales bacterium]|nr:chitobiase/beta-hexosaminidase C-terminal domain-containing protein [Bacteroidales bacterium]